MPINFTIVDDGSTNDEADTTGDINEIPVTGELHFVAQMPEGMPALSPLEGTSGKSRWIRTFYGYYDTDGVLKNKPGGTPGVKLWANDPDALNLEGGLPYLVFAPEGLRANGKVVEFTPFVFYAPGSEVTLKFSELKPVPSATAKGISRGFRGFRSGLVKVSAEGVTPVLYRWQDEEGVLWGPSRPYTEMFADSAAIAAEGAAPAAMTAEIESRDAPQIIADPDNPSTHIRWTWGDAVSPPMPGTATTMDLIGDAKAAGKAVARSETSAAARDVLDVPSRVQQGVAGRLVCILDDGFASHMAAIAEAEKRDQKLNMALTQDFIGTGGKINSTQARQAAARGVGIGLHSKTHPNLTTVDMPTLIDEMALPQRQIGSLIGKGLDRSDMWFVYPQSAKNLTTLSTGYLRYDRQFAGPFDPNVPYRTSFWRPKPHLCGRLNWASDRHAIVMAEIQAAAAADEDIVIYTHATDGSASNGVTLDEFKEVLDLAMRIGMKMVTVNEFLYGGPNFGLGRHFGLFDPSFEAPGVKTADLQAYFDANWEIISGSTGTATIVDTSAATGVVGSRALKITRTGTAAGNCIVQQRVPIPIGAWIEQLAPVVMAARGKAVITSGSGGLSLQAICANADGVPTSGGSGSAQVSPTYTGSDWSAAGALKTADLVNYTAYPYVYPRYRAVNALGEFFFDHVQMSLGSIDSFA